MICAEALRINVSREKKKHRLTYSQSQSPSEILGNQNPVYRVLLILYYQIVGASFGRVGRRLSFLDFFAWVLLVFGQRRAKQYKLFSPTLPK